MLNRRDFLAATIASSLAPFALRAETTWTPKYLLSSAMYGQEPLATVLAEATTLEMTAIDLWPKVHGAHREVVDKIGADAARSLVAEAGCRVECLTRYDLGALGLAEEITVARSLGAGTIVSGPKGSKTPPASKVRGEVKAFVTKMLPMYRRAADNGVTIAIENHRRNLFETADSLRYLAEATGNTPGAGIALAPAHLPQDPEAIATLIRDLGDSIAVFYAWERGNEFLRKEPTGREREQLPGRGSFDFTPLIEALADIDYEGWTSIFMHPIPRGVPAAGTVQETTQAIAEARRHLESL